jgi:hypothetical protein
MITKSKKVLTVGLTAAALTTASVALAGDAYAGGRHGRFFHGFHGHHGGLFITTPVSSGCWKWINFRKVWVCH